MTVAVDCHRCMAEAQNQASESHTLALAAGSGRSSLKSFCSCHTERCCCLEDDGNYAGDEDDDDDDDEETTGQRESFCTAADHTIVSTPTQEEAHSSTLTPLSTQEHTMRSELADDDDDDRDAITDADASSISQSAEYYSLSSTAGPQPGAIAPLKEAARGGGGGGGGSSSGGSNSSSKCHRNSNWSKHIRLKDNSSPLDTHL